MAAYDPYSYSDYNDGPSSQTNPASSAGQFPQFPAPTTTGGFTPDPSMNGTTYPLGGLPAGPDTHWDPTSRQFVNNAQAPPPGPGGGVGPGPAAGSVFDPNAGQNFQFPTFTPPTYAAPPTYTPPPAFSYADFQAPTLDEAQNQPGYQFGLQQGLGALQNSQAAKGLVRTGGSLKDLFSFGDQFANQNYGNVLTQDEGIYSTNRANAADAWTKNYGAGLDTANYNLSAANQQFQNQNTSALEAFNPSFQAASLKFSDLYQRWLAGLNANTTLAGYGAS